MTCSTPGDHQETTGERLVTTGFHPLTHRQLTDAEKAAEPVFGPHVTTDAVEAAMATMRLRSDLARERSRAFSGEEAAALRGKSVGYRLASDVLESLLSAARCDHDWIEHTDEPLGDEPSETVLWCYLCGRSLHSSLPAAVPGEDRT